MTAPEHRLDAAGQAGGPGQDGGFEPAVSITGLVKRYGSRGILDGVDLSVHRGELLALLGPNGAGKTTLVEIIEGYRRADGGRVRVLGRDPWRPGSDLRARLGLMLQEGGVDPRVRPLEALRLYASFYRAPRDPAEVLETVGLARAAGTSYRRLSGGERQRLALGLALIGRPELLILDEPTAGMDPAGRGQTRGLISDLRTAGGTILLTTHDLGDVERLADRVTILDRGRIVASGSPADLSGGRAATLRVRLAAPPSQAQIQTAETTVAAERPGIRLEADPSGGPADLRVAGGPPDPALIAALATAFAVEGIQILELRTSSGTLEERYLELTGDATVEGGAGFAHAVSETAA
jgi:ABC-2 type transport system ATP-binding protein